MDRTPEQWADVAMLAIFDAQKNGRVNLIAIRAGIQLCADFFDRQIERRLKQMEGERRGRDH
jgi:hypothetical protein